MLLQVVRFAGRGRVLCVKAAGPSSEQRLTCGHQPAYRTLHSAASSSPPVLRTVDMVSDTVTKPSRSMLEAMTSAEVGDDVRGEDPTVNALQEKVAYMFGKEAALFVPSGTMGNLISILSHCLERGSEVMLGDRSHCYLYEQGGCAQLGGVHSNALRTKRDGTFDVVEMLDAVHGADWQHEAKTRLVCLENTHNYCGGTVLPLAFMERVYTAAKEQGMQVHLDGARIMNACVASSGGLNTVAVGSCVDSLNMCFSKGLGAPAGSIVIGSRAFIERATRVRKAVGGGMRQIGILAAAAIYALDNNVSKLKRDHDNARMLARAILAHKASFLSIDLSTVQTNIVMVDFLEPARLNAVQFSERMLQVTPAERKDLGQSISVRMMAFHGVTKARFVTHLDLDDNDIQAAKTKFSYVIKEYMQTLA